jgi:hypothetical protein
MATTFRVKRIAGRVLTGEDAVHVGRPSHEEFKAPAAFERRLIVLLDFGSIPGPPFAHKKPSGVWLCASGCILILGLVFALATLAS